MLPCSTHLRVSTEKCVAQHFNLCRVPGEFCYVADPIIFCRVMRVGSVNVAMEIVLTIVSCWYSIVCAKNDYSGDN